MMPVVVLALMVVVVLVLVSMLPTRLPLITRDGDNKLKINSFTVQ
jgi:hypothetical protein